MKHALRKATAMILVLALSISVFSLSASSADQYPSARSLRWVYGDNNTLKAAWDIDYSVLPEGTSVSGTLTFRKWTEEYEKNLLSITFNGKAKEIDVTDYARWYFADADGWYYYTLALTYTSSSGTVKKMSSIASPSLSNNIFILPDPVIADINMPNLREGYDALDIDVHWQNMKAGYKLEMYASLNGRRVIGMNLVPDRSYSADDTCRVTLKPSEDLPAALKQGDIVGIEIKLLYGEEYIGDTFSYQSAVLPKTVSHDSGTYTLVAICNPGGQIKSFEISPGATEQERRTVYNSACQWLYSQGAASGSVGYGAVYDDTRYYVNGRRTDRQGYENADNGSAETLERRVDCTAFVFNRISAVRGDVDRCGEVTVVDVAWIRRYLIDDEIPMTESDIMLGDADGSGKTELPDATFIQKYLADMDSPYRIGELVN